MADPGQCLAKSNDIKRMLGQFVRSAPELAKIGLNAKSHTHTHIGEIQAEICPNLADMDRTRPKSINKSTDTGDSGRSRSGFGRNWPNTVECRQHWPKSARFAPTLDDFGRTCPDVGQIWRGFGQSSSPACAQGFRNEAWPTKRTPYMHMLVARWLSIFFLARTHACR